jgi:hypothetical protein
MKHSRRHRDRVALNNLSSVHNLTHTFGRTRRLCKVERDQDQVVYVFRAECSKEFRGQSQARLCLTGTPKPISQSRQDHDEDEN